MGIGEPAYPRLRLYRSRRFLFRTRTSENYRDAANYFHSFFPLFFFSFLGKIPGVLG